MSDGPNDEDGERCWECSGKGKVECEGNILTYGTERHPPGCPACGGENIVTCPECHGRGR